MDGGDVGVGHAVVVVDYHVDACFDVGDGEEGCVGRVGWCPGDGGRELVWAGRGWGEMGLRKGRGGEEG